MFSHRLSRFAPALALIPVILGAQPARPRQPQPPPQPGARQWRDPSATELLNRRRELDLTPRQVARLDSIERQQFARTRGIGDQVRRLRDSTCGPQARCTAEQRLTLQTRMRELRSQQMDTTARRAAMALLDSTQRGRVQGWQMSRRRAAMAMGRAQAGRPGLRRDGRFRDGVGPRGRGPMGPGREPGFGRGWQGPARRGLMPPPRWDDVGPDDRMAPRRPMRPRRPGDAAGIPDSTSLNDDTRG